MGLVDDARWPLVVVKWPAGVPSDEELDETLRVLAGFYGRRHAVLHDGVRAAGLTARQRQRMVHHSTQHEDEIRASVVASAAVARSPLVRGMIALIQWMAPTPSPFRSFAARDEAEEWLLHALRRAGVWRPSALEKSKAHSQ